MSADVLLARLELVQRNGTGWRAACPACGGRSRKLSVTEADDGRVLVHCFSGCSATEVVQAVGLTLADLFPERLAADSPDERRRRRRLAREAQWGAALEALTLEAHIVAIAARELLCGQELDWNDYCRLVQAIERIEDAKAVLREEPRCSREQGVRLPRYRAA